MGLLDTQLLNTTNPNRARPTAVSESERSVHTVQHDRYKEVKTFAASAELPEVDIGTGRFVSPWVQQRSGVAPKPSAAL